MNNHALLAVLLSFSVPLMAMEGTTQNPENNNNKQITTYQYIDQNQSLLSLLESFILGEGRIKAVNAQTISFPHLSKPNALFIQSCKQALELIEKTSKEKVDSFESGDLVGKILRAKRLHGSDTKTAIKQVVENMSSDEKLILQIHRVGLFEQLFTIPDEENLKKMLETIAVESDKDIKQQLEHDQSDESLDYIDKRRELKKIMPTYLSSRYSLIRALKNEDEKAINSASAQMISCDQLPPLQKALYAELSEEAIEKKEADHAAGKNSCKTM